MEKWLTPKNISKLDEGPQKNELIKTDREIVFNPDYILEIGVKNTISIRKCNFFEFC